MKLTALILLTLAIISGLFASQLQKAADQEKRYAQAFSDVQRLLSSLNSSPELMNAWADLTLRDKELNVRRGLGRGVAWIALGFSALSLIFLYVIKPERSQRAA